MNTYKSRHDKYWSQLKELSDKDDINSILGFFKLYLEYLQSSGVISPSRQILYKMISKLILYLSVNT